jgi:hypothetical protein
VLRRPAAVLPDYAELHCRSNFSFLSGASHPEELIARAQALRYSALAITDECSLAGVVRAHAAAEQLKFPCIVGAEMQLSPELRVEGDPKRQRHSTPEPRLLLLAESRRGYGNLVRWITAARQRAPKGQYLALRDDVEGKMPTLPMLAGLPGCLALLVPDGTQSFENVFEHAMWLKTWVGTDRSFIAVELLQNGRDKTLIDTVQRVAGFTGLPIVATGGVRMHLRSRRPLLDALTATRLKRPLSDCGLALESNAESHLRSRLRLARLYRPEWLANTLVIAGRCGFRLSELKYEYPREIVPEGHTPTSWLRQLTEAGALRRFPEGLARHDLAADAVVAEGDLRDEDDAGAAGDAGVRGDPAGVAAHHLDDHDAVVARRGRPEAVERVGGEGHRGVEAEGDDGAAEVVVDGLGHADDGDAGPEALEGDGEGAVAADDDERAESEVVEVLLRLGEDGGIDLLGLAVADLGGEAAAVRRAEDGAAEVEEAVHLEVVEDAGAHRLEQALETAEDAEGFPTALGGGLDDRVDDCVQAGAIASAGEDADALFHKKG